MNRRAILAVALLLTAVPALAQITIKGKVANAATQKGIAGVLIRCEHHENRNAKVPDDFAVTAHTAASGEFCLVLPKEEKEYAVLVTDAQGHVYDGRTHVDEDTDFGTVVLRKDCVLDGKVVGPNGKPLAGAKVVFDFRFPKVGCTHYIKNVAETVTQEDGVFQIKNLSPATYLCRTKVGDLAPPRKQIAVGDDLNYVELMLQKGAVIQGTVRGPDHAPLAGVTIKAEDADAVKSGPDGAFRIVGLPAGKLDVEITADGHALPDRDELQVTCKAGETVQKDIALVRAGTLALKLVPETTVVKVPDRVSISFSTRSGDEHRSFHRSANVTGGVARIVGMPGGKFEATVRGKGMPDCRAEASIRPSAETTIEVKVPRSFELRGQVTDSAGVPLARAQVRLQSQQPKSVDVEEELEIMKLRYGTSSRSVTTDKNGAFVMDGIATGAYEVTADAKTFVATSQKITVAPSGPQPLAFRLAKGLRITGTVLNSDGSAPKDIKVLCSGPKGTTDGFRMRRILSEDADVNANGSFEISGLATGKYDITVRTAESYEELAKLPDVTAGTEDVMIRLGLLLSVEGTVRDPAGRPVTGAVLVANRAQEGEGGFGSFYFSTGRAQENAPRTDAQGKFRLPLREGARYSITVAKKPWLPAMANVDLSTPAAVKSRSSVELKLEEGCSLKGQVLSGATRAPVPNVRVAVSGDNPFETAFMMAMGRGEDESEGTVGPPSGETDAKGRFELSGVRPGIVTVAVYGSGKRPHVVASKKVQVSRGRAAEVTIETGATGNIKGVVKGGSGKPAADAHVIAFNVQNPTAGQFTGKTQDDGTFLIESVPAGSYMVTAVVVSVTQRQATPHMKSVTVEAGKTAEVNFGGETGGIRIGGRVTRNGAPVGPGTMTLTTKLKEGAADMESVMAMFSGMANGRVTTNGVFALKDVRPGAYVYHIALSTRQKGAGTSAAEEEGAAWMGGGRSFSGSFVVEAGKTNYNLTISGVVVRLEVADAKGAALSGATTAISPAGAALELQVMSLHGVTGKDGACTLEGVPAGTYDIHVQSEQGATTRKGVEVKDKDLLVRMALKAAVKLSGSIRLGDGGPASGTMLMILTADGKTPVAYEMIGPNGTYTVNPPLEAGHYIVIARKDGYAVEAKEIHLDRPSTFNATLEPAGDVEIALRGPAGSDLSGKTILTKTADGNEVFRITEPGLTMGFGLVADMCASPTDKQGAARIRSLKAGDYVFEVKGTGKKGVARVKAMETSRVEINLSTP